MENNSHLNRHFDLDWIKVLTLPVLLGLKKKNEPTDNKFRVVWKIKRSETIFELQRGHGDGYLSPFIPNIKRSTGYVPMLPKK